MSWRSLILAGSRGPSDPVARHCGVAHKAFAPIAGRPMIAHVIETVAASRASAEITVSIEADAALLPDGPALGRLDAAASPAKSVLAAFEAMATPLLVTTADHPLLTPAMIDDFLEQSTASGADITAAVATRATVEKAGNPARRTYLKFSDAHVSGANLFALRTPAAKGALSFWVALEAQRKSPWRMARQLGLGVLARYLAGGLSSQAAMRRLGVLTGCKAALITLDHPLAAHDVDKPCDLDFAEAALAARPLTGFTPR